MIYLDSDITGKKLLDLLSSDHERLGELYKTIIERKFYVSDADISRKTLSHWQKEELLVYPYTEEGWTKFSFIEYSWLRCIAEFRNLGLPIEKIRVIKDCLFDINVEEYKKFFFEAIKATAEGTVKEKNEILAVFKRKDIPEKVWIDAMNQVQVSYFAVLLLDCVINNRNTCLTLDKDSKCRPVVFGKFIKASESENLEQLSLLFSTSFIVVNLLQVVRNFFANDKIRYDSEYILTFLNSKEQKILEKIRLGGIKEVNIHFENNEPVRMEIGDTKITEKVLTEVSKFLKKEEYATITLKTQKGKLIGFNKKTITKF